MKNEILQPIETSITPFKKDGASFAQLNAELINEVISDRKNRLEKIKPEISRKLYYIMEEKIIAQEKHLNDILDWRQGKLSQLSKYSLILNSNYFEQEFLAF